ncbi:hypothetical protein GW17_00048748 [Ensete ventricosum]|nr:hypothetical protein GW17_00048748 [Ensete ventricosum]
MTATAIVLAAVLPVAGGYPCGRRHCPRAAIPLDRHCSLRRHLHGRCPLQAIAPVSGMLGNLSGEIVYPCIPYPDGEDEGGQASSSLAVSTLWISVVKLLQYDLATFA